MMLRIWPDYTTTLFRSHPGSGEGIGEIEHRAGARACGRAAVRDHVDYGRFRVNEAAQVSGRDLCWDRAGVAG
jgi:hypothetical protein